MLPEIDSPFLPERNLDVFASPDAERGVHRPKQPPLLARGEHAHRDWREVVAFATAAPKLVQIGCHARRTPDSVPRLARKIHAPVHVEVDEVYRRVGVRGQIAMRCRQPIRTHKHVSVDERDKLATRFVPASDARLDQSHSLLFHHIQLQRIRLRRMRTRFSDGSQVTGVEEASSMTRIYPFTQREMSTS